MRALRHHSFLQTLLWLCALCLLATTAQASQLVAKTDRTTLSVNESLTLTLSYQGQAMGAPDFSELEKDFDILSRQQQSQLSFGFGDNTSTTEWVLALMPRRSGQLHIPAFNFKGEVSDPIAIEVTEEQAASDSSQPIFIETELEKDSAYVQSQVIFSLRLNTAVMMSSVDISDLDIPGARVIKVHDAQYQKSLNGREYIVVEMKYAIFPEQPGTLEIPAVTINGVVPDRNDPFAGRSMFGSRGKPVRLKSDAKTLEVLTIPDGAAGGNWIPSKGLSISQRWSSKPDNLTVGEPITRSITLTAQGLTGAQLPPLNIEEGQGYKTYPDQPDISETLSESGVLGTRSESVAIVPTAPGTLTLPGVRVRWWDTTAATFRETKLDEVTVTVAPAAGADGAGQATAAEQEETETANAPESPQGTTAALPDDLALFASLLTNVVLAIAVIILALLWRKRLPPLALQTGTGDPKAQSAEELEKTAFKKLLATNNTDLRALRQQVLHWARLYWPQAQIHTLDDIKALCANKELNNLFTNMDNSLYGKHSAATVAGEDILRALKDIRQQRKKSGAAQPSLPPLYPTSPAKPR